MRPSYSRLLDHEFVLPVVGAEQREVLVDMLMTRGIRADRDEARWESLLERSGLKIAEHTQGEDGIHGDECQRKRAKIRRNLTGTACDGILRRKGRVLHAVHAIGQYSASAQIASHIMNSRSPSAFAKTIATSLQVFRSTTRRLWVFCEHESLSVSGSLSVAAGCDTSTQRLLS